MQRNARASEFDWGSGRAQRSLPKEMCRAICRGLLREIAYSGAKLTKLVDIGAKTKTSEKHQDEAEQEWRQAWDDVTGQELDPREVSKARLKEMKYVDGEGCLEAHPEIRGCE